MKRISDILSIGTVHIAFFDFDRTLCSHDYIRTDSLYDEYVSELNPDRRLDKHRNDRPLKGMQEFIHELKVDGTKIVVLTHTLSNLRDEGNKSFILQNYRKGIDYLSVSKAEYKTVMIDAYTRNRLRGKKEFPYEILFVDDRMDLLEDAEEYFKNSEEVKFIGVSMSSVISAYDSIKE